MSSYSDETKRREYEEGNRRYVREPFLPSFDQMFYEEFGEYPRESPLYGTRGPASDRRRAAVQALIEQGATEGERAAARAALDRLDAPHDQGEAERLARDVQDEADYEDAAAFGEA